MAKAIERRIQALEAAQRQQNGEDDIQIRCVFDHGIEPGELVSLKPHERAVRAIDYRAGLWQIAPEVIHEPDE